MRFTEASFTFAQFCFCRKILLNRLRLVWAFRFLAFFKLKISPHFFSCLKKANEISLGLESELSQTLAAFFKFNPSQNPKEAQVLASPQLCFESFGKLKISHILKERVFKEFALLFD